MSDNNKPVRSITSRPISEVQPYIKNAKIHDPAQVMKIAKSIKEYGWDQPIVVDEEGVIIKGHGRRLAAIELGMKNVPVMVIDDLSPEQIKASRIADNRVAEGDVDTDLLQEELFNLSIDGANLDAMGFDERELDFLTDDLGEMDVESLINDLDLEVSEQADRVESKSKDADERQVRLSEAFGFSYMNPEQSRNINKFMAGLEDESGLSGADALDDFVKKLVAEW